MNMYYFYSIIFIPLIFLISFKISVYLKLYDHPDNIRKIHLKPTLITGGIFFELIFLFYFLFFLFVSELNYLTNSFNNSQDHLILLGTISISFLIGLYDDKKNLNAIIKLILMYLIFVISLFFLSDIYQVQKLNSYFNYSIYFNSLSIFFTSFCFVILLNAVNMADGINSLSSNIFIIWLLFISIFLPLDNFYFFMNIVLICGLVLFSIFNFKNRCFLGDSGCFALISYLSFLTVYVYNQDINSQINIFNLESIFLLFLIPGIDMVRLFTERIYKRKNPLKGDRNHFHHKLLYSFGNFKSLLIYNLLIIFPWLLYLISTTLLPYLIIVVIVIYIFVIIKLK